MTAILIRLSDHRDPRRVEAAATPTTAPGVVLVFASQARSRSVGVHEEVEVARTYSALEAAAGKLAAALSRGAPAPEIAALRRRLSRARIEAAVAATAAGRCRMRVA